MGVENQRSGCGGSGNEDKFPVGMRVLAVDDDPICLKVLENLLRKCQYHVTTTNQSLEALKMLRENRNNYDLLISDVNMPGMDGFKLLELVGKEMDLPVIMLSAHTDKELVCKGVTHGAVDYLLKPVRIEELKNIWQHVMRKKLQPKDKKRSANREEQEDEDEEEGEDEEHGTRKRPRTVWTVEMHRKFVAAVDQLSLEQAVPEEILDLMNVNCFTREDVATHLQKYKLYLKRISGLEPMRPRIVWTVEMHRKFVAAVDQLSLEKAVPEEILDLMNVNCFTREDVATHLQKYKDYLKKIGRYQQANLVAVNGAGSFGNSRSTSPTSPLMLKRIPLLVLSVDRP
ncbi:hypothetical protein Tsubulata_011978 [Turnera subulata]|uniref:Two-component response regulator n=1 Tax=Turnera subulata TaxID=218843 RepID=A0A9Q0J7E2_9ROSI|nr:hypothetical protein Tsubulata_011978 [Turnera subulata]